MASSLSQSILASARSKASSHLDFLALGSLIYHLSVRLVECRFGFPAEQ
nr:MAG TPA: hypothetical protein [Caudoviricetes sp.]